MHLKQVVLMLEEITGTIDGKDDKRSHYYRICLMVIG